MKWNPKCAEALISAGADVNVTIPCEMWGQVGLLHSASTRRLSVVQLLLDGGADVDMLSGDGSTPLMRLMVSSPDSTSWIIMEKFKLFMDHGANCSVVNKNGFSVSDTHLAEDQDYARRIRERLNNERWSRRACFILERYKSKKGGDRYTDAKVTKVTKGHEDSDVEVMEIIDIEMTYERMKLKCVTDWVVGCNEDGVFRHIVQYL